MRILSIAFALATVADGAVGGAEQVLAQIDNGLVSAGHESIVVAASDSQVRGTLFGTSKRPSRVTKEYYGFRYTEHQSKITEALASGPVDLVHMHGFDFYEFIPKGDVPVLATLHLPPTWYRNWIYQIDRPHFYLNCVSTSQRMQAPESALIVRTIPNGVHIPHFDPLPITERAGAVMLGRICPEKGTHIGIAAARRAGIPLTVAGDIFGYPEHVEYFEREVGPALNATTRFVGPVGLSDKMGLLRSAQCLLVPSNVPETSSLVSMEALACGTPVIAMRSGALPEIVEDGKTGFIVGSMEQMVAAMHEVYRIDPMVCRDEARRRFSRERMVNEYISLYEELIHAKRLLECFTGESIAQPRPV